MSVRGSGWRAAAAPVAAAAIVGLGAIGLSGCGGTSQDHTAAQTRHRTPVANSLDQAAIVAKSESGLCDLLSDQGLRDAFSVGGEQGRRTCRKAFSRLGIPPIASFHVISAGHGRARVRASSEAGTSVVLDFSRVDGRWLLDGLPEPANH